MNARTYFFELPTINWADGANYTVELYLDTDGINTGGRFSLFIYRNATLAASAIIDSNFDFLGVAAASAVSAPFRLTDLQIANMFFRARQTGISLSDARITLRMVNFGEGRTMGRDFLLNGAFEQKRGNNTIGSTSGSATLALANNHGQLYYGIFERILLNFRITETK